MKNLEMNQENLVIVHQRLEATKRQQAAINLVNGQDTAGRLHRKRAKKTQVETLQKETRMQIGDKLQQIPWIESKRGARVVLTYVIPDSRTRVLYCPAFLTETERRQLKKEKQEQEWE